MKHSPGRCRRLIAAIAAATIATPLLLTSAATAQAAPAPTPVPEAGAGAEAAPALPAPPGAPERPQQGPGEELARELVRSTTALGAHRHLRAFQRIADRNNGNRASGTSGYDSSAAYAVRQLERAGYDVGYQHFEFPFREAVAERLVQLTPERADIAINVMTYTADTPVGGVEAELALVTGEPETGAGCSAEDFASGDFEGRIALIERGVCPFAEKQALAADAGAIGAVIYNNGEGVLRGTLGSPGAGVIPTGGISRTDGQALAAALGAGDEIRVDFELRELEETRWTSNVLAETPGGDPESVVMVGAHLDSVVTGPGINDNASGSAGVLEAALRFADATGLASRAQGRADEHGAHSANRIRPQDGHQNKVRFVLWGAEERGLLGAHHYVDTLVEEERESIALYLNFDMIASPNHGMFVYDGDGSEGLSAPGPDGSAQIEHTINSFMEQRGYHPRPTAFNGRSDYGPFLDAGIPAGGTFTGAEGVKTEEQAELWGGTAGEAYDSCYHELCDDLRNISMPAFDAHVKTIAHLVGTYAWSTESLAGAVPEGRPADPGTADSAGRHLHAHLHRR